MSTIETSFVGQVHFNALAATWLQLGAQCVWLTENGKTLVAFPAPPETFGPDMIGLSEDGTFAFCLSGVVSPTLQHAVTATARLFAAQVRAESELEGLTASLVETQDRLVAVYDLTQATRHTLDIPVLVELLMSESRRLLDTAGVFVVIQMPDQPAMIRQDMDQLLSESQLMNAATLYRANPSRHTFNDGTTIPANLRNVGLVEIPIRAGIFACLGALNRHGNFTSPDIKLLQAISQQIGAQLENALLHDESLARARFETEMDLARQVQNALLPQRIPILGTAEIYGTSNAALQVGGDFFDIVLAPNNPLVFLLGDVTGKGMPAALLMAMTHAIAKAAMHHVVANAPHQIMNKLNAELFDDFSTVGRFATAFAGFYDETNRQISFCNAGQSPILYLPAAGAPTLLEAEHIPIGIFSDYPYSSAMINMMPGDVLVIASDGFNEARNPADEMFGIERMKVALQSLAALSAREIADGVILAVKAFAGSHPQDDDMTILVLKIKELPAMRTLKIAASYEALRAAADALRNLLHQANAPEEIVSGCELAVQELLTNIVDHAYAGDPSQQIEISLRVDENRFIVETSDQGAATRFDPLDISMPDPSELAEGGYGMALITALMDEISYQRTDGKNLWRLAKQFARAADQK